jgi:hypothetical protein
MNSIADEGLWVIDHLGRYPFGQSVHSTVPSSAVYLSKRWAVKGGQASEILLRLPNP